MALIPNTNDTHSVSKSATQKFKSFVGGVKNVQSTENVQLVYDSMTKLFDGFTHGTLSEHGANTEHILRNVCKFLDRDFLKIFENANAVDKIAEVIKQEQASLTADNVATSPASETTKKVVLNQLDPDNCNVNEVALDFIQELQTAALKVRQDLNRELADARQRDMDMLQETLSSRGQDQLGQTAEEQEKWKSEKVKQLEEMMRVFDTLDGDFSTLNGKIGDIEDVFKSDATIRGLVGRKKDDIKREMKQWNDLLAQMNGRSKGVSQEQDASTQASAQQIASPQESKIEQVETKQKKEQQVATGLKLDVKDVKDVEKSIKESSEQSKLIKGMGKMDIPSPEGKREGTKIQQPAQNGMCACPVCGDQHSIGGKGGTKITEEGVSSTIGVIHQNIVRQLRNKKFHQAFSPNYRQIQGGISKQMKKVDKTENKIHSILGKTKWQIFKLKAKSKANGLLSLLLGGLSTIGFIAIGAVILITLTRMALKKWKDTYMPKPDGSKMTVFGIPIPGWDEMKSIGLGIYNFVTVGLKNWGEKLMNFFGNIKKQLFGKKGALRDGIETRNTLRKIFMAWLIGMTQSVGGWIVKGLCWALSFIPFVGPVFKFLGEFGPELYKFISTQIMLGWNNKKADAEREAQAAAADQLNDTPARVRAFKGMLMSASKGVKPFTGQLAAIPNLNTAMGPGGVMGPKKSAIMRSVDVKAVVNAERGQKVQEGQIDEDKIKEETNERIKKRGPGDALLVRIHADMEQINTELNSHMKEWKKKRWFYSAFEWGQEYGKKWGELRSATLRKTLMPQIQALDKYFHQLLQSKRFKGVEGVLYDPNTGWNPGYRVLASDLRSIIPLRPFEALHSTPDIYFGQPSPPETTSKGFMPYTWIQDGVKISVNPLKYEAWRTLAIKKIYQKLYDDAGDPSFWTLSSQSADLGKLSVWWTQWNKALAEHDIGEYADRDDVVYGDKFANFFNKMRREGLSEKDNNLRSALKRDGLTTWQKIGLGAAVLATGGFGLIGIGAAWAAPKVVEAGKKVAANIRRVFDYDKKEMNGPGKDAGWWEKTKYAAKVAARKAQTAKILMDMRAVKLGSVSYGLIRDLMIDHGLLDIFQTGVVNGTVGTALSILKFLFENGFMPKGPKVDGANYMHDLMYQFFQFANIAGYDWANVKGDTPTQAAFAQTFLEYLVFNALPQWNVVEGLLTAHMTERTHETESKLVKGIIALLEVFKHEKIFGFMREHLRFPNMMVKIIDYANAKTNMHRLALDKFRRDLGIPTPGERDVILKKWIGIWGRISGMSDDELNKGILELKPIMKGAAFEAKYTGDVTFIDQLRKVWDALQSEYNRRTDAKMEGAAIVKKPGNMTTKVLEPPRTMAEIEADRKKKEVEEAARKAEEERKAKEERERKLKEEAKRKEELAVAEARQKAMEAIRKQEQQYETILEKMVSDPGKVTDKELKELGDNVSKLKQEAENRIAKLPRAERELKLALIRGDKISEKTFTEIKETAVGLHGNLREYVEEVNKIPVGNVLAINNAPTPMATNPIRMQDSDNVDLGDE